jgi:peptide-methionine (S)-S-oxide reductase
MTESMATVGGGCFWCTEAVFPQFRGVKSVVSGYSGGEIPDPTYNAVCSGATGHAECVQITFDSDVISYRDLLDVFFHTHDPTTLNQQGADRGTQYRSVIFFHDDEQRQQAEQFVRELDESRECGSPIVTQIASCETFYAAEDYHQDYYQRNLTQPYCNIAIGPKLAKLKSRFADRLIDN